MRTDDLLRRPTLVLNRSWLPVGTASVARALVLLWSDSARAIDPETYRLFAWDDWAALPVPAGEPALRSARLRVRVPEVVGLTRYDRLPRRGVAFSRRNVARRDRFTCQYCGDQPGLDALTIDHVVPRAAGGPTSWTNCVAACVRCNGRKADRTPEQAGMPLRARPDRTPWKPHDALPGPRAASWSRFLAPA